MRLEIRSEPLLLTVKMASKVLKALRERPVRTADLARMVQTAQTVETETPQC